MRTVVIGCGDGFLRRSIMSAMCAHSVAVAHTPEGISVCGGIDIQREDFSFQFNHSGWSNVSGVEEAMRLTNMAIESLAKSYSFDPDVEFTIPEFDRYHIRDRVKCAADRMEFEIKNYAAEDEYFPIKEVPHYIDLDRKKKKSASLFSIVKSRRPINNPIQGRCY